MALSSGYLVLMAAIGVERLAELWLTRRNLAWSFANGGREWGREHYPFMVLIHVALLAGCIVEPLWSGTEFDPSLGWPMFALVVLAQGLRWWCIGSLGKQWNTRVVVIPGQKTVRSGPYRIFPHPNYVAVVVEGIALPLIHGAWWTAILFSLANAVVLWIRIKCENQALKELEAAR